MEHSYYSQPDTSPAADAKATLQAAASTFSQNIQEATTKLAAAAEQFGTMSEGLLAAVEDARSASDRAQAAQRATEETQERLTGIMRQLQERLGALASLANAFDMPAESAPSSSETQAPEEPQHPSW